jgi:protein-S-isoprenylcysteine O-methyltransferase Ste14
MNTERINEFSDEVSQLQLRAGRGDRERILLATGIVALVAGVVLAVAGGITASGAATALDQTSALATSTYIGIALLIAGAALFIRYSVGRLLRFWMVRLVHEQRSETDRLIAAIEKMNQGNQA